MRNAQIIADKKMTAEEAASLIENGEVIGTSGFTPAGYPKEIPIALAAKARKLNEQNPGSFSISLYTGASVGDELDGELARAGAIRKRLPYQSNKDIRASINSGDTEFIDFHLSHLAQYLRYGFIEPCKTAIVEASGVTNDGKIFLTMSGGMSATFLSKAERIFIELNEFFDEGIRALHDVYVPDAPPFRAPIPIFHPSDRIGSPYVKVDPNKIVGIVLTNRPDSSPSFRAPDETSKNIARNVIEFIRHEKKYGRLPDGLPYQSGVGNVANAVLQCIADFPDFEPISMYTEVIQDSIFHLLEADRLEIASTCSMTLSKKKKKKFFDNFD